MKIKLNEVDFSRFDDENADLGTRWQDEFDPFVEKLLDEVGLNGCDYTFEDDYGQVLITEHVGSDPTRYLIWDERRASSDVNTALMYADPDEFFDFCPLENFENSTDDEILDCLNSDDLDDYEKQEEIINILQNTLFPYSPETEKQIAENWDSYFCDVFDYAEWYPLCEDSGTKYYYSFESN